MAKKIAELEYRPFDWLEKLCEQQGSKAGELIEGSIACEAPLAAWKKAQTLLGIDADALTELVLQRFDLARAHFPASIAQDLVSSIPRRVAEQYMIFPLELKDGHLIIAASNPADKEMASILGFLTGHYIEVRVSAPSVIYEWVDEYYPDEKPPIEEIKIKSQQSSSDTNGHEIMAGDSAIVEIVSDMLLEAFSMNASDIHIEPYKQGGMIRYRVDGLLRVITELPQQVYVPIVQRIKAISRLNLAKKMVPQDGGASLEVRGQEVDLRVSTLPVKGGEKVVIRLLVKSAVGQLDDIGLQQKELKVLKSVLQNSSGIFVITGPTGSGKTSTLYAALNQLNAPETCLVTVEDPVEYEIDGIAQISINPAQDLTFYSALRSILRQDPDVILLGEVRDEETAEITFRAAITGHFVMTTLHTNDAITTIPRLLGLGIPATVIADSLRGMASQRLVRKLCQHCVTDATEQNEKYLQRLRIKHPDLSAKSSSGCDQCDHTGYKGRMPLIELVVINDLMADAIRSGQGNSVLRRIARDSGYRSLNDVALSAVADGKTSVSEVHRVLGETFWRSLSIDSSLFE